MFFFYSVCNPLRIVYYRFTSIVFSLYDLYDSSPYYQVKPPLNNNCGINVNKSKAELALSNEHFFIRFKRDTNSEPEDAEALVEVDTINMYLLLERLYSQGSKNKNRIMLHK
uniref:Uncharacterized protein n=1 Tax=Cacopsylla melanoneura TaxID=428564 RepID=A0A8D8YUF2_9HEMI